MANDNAGHLPHQPLLPATPPSPEQQLRRLVEQEPRNAAAWQQLGLLALKQGRHDTVIECLGQAVALDPKQPLLRHYLAASYLALGQAEQAASHFQQLAVFSPSHEAFNNLGVALGQLGRNDEAIAAFSQALAHKPDSHEAHHNWGLALLALGKLDQAIEHFQQALTLHPDYPEAHNHLGLALARLQRHADARAAFEQGRFAEADDILETLTRQARLCPGLQQPGRQPPSAAPPR
jgi:tetratricopeptide (TPR) repeat protein